ncbi:MAG TPA: Fic family protein [Chitinophagales bacterium]|nr:Fic family protein [Chitinophagales bacterium]
MRKLLNNICLEAYNSKQRFTLAKHLKQLEANNTEPATFYFLRSSIYSSLIEGSTIDIDRYFSNLDAGYSSREMKQLQDLVETYRFARSKALTYANLMKAHEILSRNFEMPDHYKGHLRDKEVRVGNFLTTVYVGLEVKRLAAEFELFFSELNELKQRKNYTLNEAFYYASLTHLVFVKIHPFADGNGRLARLLEKWFLAQIIGDRAWKIPSEASYYLKREQYYKNLQIGKNYDEIKYRMSVPFLLMLPGAFSVSKKFYK